VFGKCLASSAGGSAVQVNQQQHQKGSRHSSESVLKLEINTFISPYPAGWLADRKMKKKIYTCKILEIVANKHNNTI
jgi:hypothetical protein